MFTIPIDPEAGAPANRFMAYSRTLACVLKDAPAGWKLESSRKVYDNYYISLYEDMLDLNGEPKLYVRGTRRDYSTVVPFVSKDKVLVIKSYRHLVDSYQVEVPAGYIEEGETPTDAAARELEEETGFKAGRIVPLGSYTLDYTMFEQRGHVFAAYDLAGGSRSLEPMEKISVGTMSTAAIRRMLASGKILNSATIVALYKALEYHERSNKRVRSG